MHFYIVFVNEFFSEYTYIFIEKNRRIQYVEKRDCYGTVSVGIVYQTIVVIFFRCPILWEIVTQIISVLQNHVFLLLAVV